jgi:predicted MFS family arabinose efflux permease
MPEPRTDTPAPALAAPVAAPIPVLAIAGLALAALAMMGFALGALGFALGARVLVRRLGELAPERRGTAVAAFAPCFFLGQSAGVGLAGLLVAHIGTGWVIAAGALAVLGVAWRFGRGLARE